MKRTIRHFATATATALRAFAARALRAPDANAARAVFHPERKSVFCIATRYQADQIVAALKTANFSPNDISVQLPDQGTSHDFAQGKQTKSAASAIVGTGVGGVVGWIVGIGMLAVWDVDPWAASLSMGALGAVVLGVAGGWVGRSVPASMASDILIAVHPKNSGEIARAKEIFTTAGAKDGCQRGDSSVEERPPPEWTRQIRPSHFLAKCPRLLKPSVLEWKQRVRAEHAKFTTAPAVPLAA